MAQHEAPAVLDPNLEIAMLRLGPLLENRDDREPALAEMEHLRVVFSAATRAAQYANFHGTLLQRRNAAISRPGALVRLDCGPCFQPDWLSAREGRRGASLRPRPGSSP